MHFFNIQITFIIFLVCGIAFSGTCQKSLNAGLGLSHFMTDGNPSSLSLDMAISYDIKPIEIELNLQHSFNTLGEKTSSTIYSSVNGALTPDQLIIPESFFSQYSTAQLFVNYRRKLHAGKPYLGMGFGLHRVRDRNQTVIHNSSFFLTNPTNKEYFQSVSFKLSIPFQHLHFSTFLHFTNSESFGYFEDNNSIIYGTSIKLNLRTKKITKIIHKKRPLFSIQLGMLNYLPIGQYDASSSRPYISIYFPINDSYAITLSNEFSGGFNGIDSGKRQTELNLSFDPGHGSGNTSAAISSIKSSVLKSSVYSEYTKVFYGLGIGFYGITGHSGYKHINQDQTVEWMPGETNLGPYITTGLISRLFNVALELNLPIGKIPVFVGIKTGFNINVYKRQKKEKYTRGQHDIKRK